MNTNLIFFRNCIKRIQTLLGLIQQLIDQNQRVGHLFGHPQSYRKMSQVM